MLGKQRNEINEHDVGNDENVEDEDDDEEEA